jgi:hypothetical protein
MPDSTSDDDASGRERADCRSSPPEGCDADEAHSKPATASAGPTSSRAGIVTDRDGVSLPTTTMARPAATVSATGGTWSSSARMKGRACTLESAKHPPPSSVYVFSSRSRCGSKRRREHSSSRSASPSIQSSSMRSRGCFRTEPPLLRSARTGAASPGRSRRDRRNRTRRHEGRSAYTEPAVARPSASTAAT